LNLDFVGARHAVPDLNRAQRFQASRRQKILGDFQVMPRNSTKPKLKLKTHRGAKKRFKITANGKIKRMHSGKRHLMGTKAPGRMRKLKKLTLVSPRDVAAVRQMLPYG
jgi:large subunit ribosomal protein L35